MKLIIDFESDWGIGTGAGRHGSIDRAVRRDADGLPMVPAKSLTGVIRDAAEQAARALDGGSLGDWHRWLAWVFGGTSGHGSPQRAALSVRPGLIEEGLRAWILAPRPEDPDSRDLVAAAFLTRPGVRIDPDTGAAADDTLRMVEHARAGLKVEAGVTWRDRAGTPIHDVPEPAQLLLGSALRLVRGLGGNRRRGAGRCRITVAEGPDLLEELARGHFGNEVPARIRELVRVGPGAPPDPVEESAQPGEQPVSEGAVRLLGTLNLTCLTPVAVGGATIGNINTSLDFIPGGLLLPIVDRVLGPEARTLIRQGRLVVTDATVAVGDGASLPAPRPLHEAKHQLGGPLRNFLVRDFLPAHRAIGGWLNPAADDATAVERVSVGMSQDAHAIIDDSAQRPTTESGGLFVQQGIAAGTVLVAQLWGPSGLDLGDTQWPPTVEVGRSNKDDYGLVGLDYLADHSDHDHHPSGSCGCRSDGTLTVWLTSDLLLSQAGRDDPSPAALAAVIAEVTKREVEVRDARFVAWRRRETWSARWGLPRPSLVGMAAGSVVVLSGVNCDGTDCPWPALAEAASRGLGRRGAEGSGRVRFNDPLLDQPEVMAERDSGTTSAAMGGAVSPGKAPANARVIADAAWGTLIEEAALRFAVDPGSRRRVIPEGATKAQLGTLRALVEVLDRDRQEGQRQAGEWLAAVRGNSAREAAWSHPDGAVSIDRWLGLASRREAGRPGADPVEGALGLGTLADRLGSARTVLLLLCISEEVRARQARARSEEMAGVTA